MPFTLFRDRNYTVMAFVSAVIAIGLIGTTITITIYLQSGLDMSPFEAGLTMAPTQVVAVSLSPMIGRLSDRISGKYILATGLTLYGVGMIWFMTIVTVSSRRSDFLPALIIAGLGQGCLFGPTMTEAMRNVEPRMTGAASGVLNTARLIGSAIGSAMAGALLQDRLAVTLTEEAARRSASVPAEYREAFVESIRAAAKNGLEVGAGQSGTVPRLPPGVPAAVAQQIRQTAETVYGHSFVIAMRPALALPIVVILIGAAACLTLKGPARTLGPKVAEPVEAPAAHRADDSTDSGTQTAPVYGGCRFGGFENALRRNVH